MSTNLSHTATGPSPGRGARSLQARLRRSPAAASLATPYSRLAGVAGARMTDTNEKRSTHFDASRSLADQDMKGKHEMTTLTRPGTPWSALLLVFALIVLSLAPFYDVVAPAMSGALF